MNTAIQLSIRRSFAAVLIGSVTLVAAPAMRAQSVATRETTLTVQRALQRLPYYGVFDFLVFGVNRGVVSVGGFAYRANLKSDASAAIKRLAGVDEIANRALIIRRSMSTTSNVGLPRLSQRDSIAIGIERGHPDAKFAGMPFLCSTYGFRS